MDFDEQIDELEARFRDPGFQERAGTQVMREIESTWVAMTRDLYQFRKLESSGAVETDEAAKLKESVQDKLDKCRKMAGLE